MTRSADIPAVVAGALVDTATWHEGRCNWVGREITTTGDGTGVLAAASPWLYDGLSGIAMFLASFHAVHGDVTAGRTAVGAMRTALRLVRPTDGALDATSRGLYLGTSGVAVAAVRVGRLTGTAELVEHGAQLAAAAARGDWPHDDLLSGRAGAVLAMVDLADELDGPEFARAAVDIAASWLDPGHEGWSLPGGWRRRPLTGLAHGYAGVGWALRALHRSVHVPSDTAAAALVAADRVFLAEDETFDAARGNWIDLRAGVHVAGTRRYMSAWCHGGPGIALARLGHPAGSGAVLAGLAVTVAAVSRDLEAPLEADPSICHGLLGNAAILLDIAKAAPDGQKHTGLALAAADRWAEVNTSEVSGLGDRGVGALPGLMLGSSGVGMTFLRFTSPNVFSPTTIVPAAGPSPTRPVLARDGPEADPGQVTGTDAKGIRSDDSDAELPAGSL